MLGGSDPRGPEEGGDGAWVPGRAGRPWHSDPQGFLVSVWSDLLGIFRGESWTGDCSDPQHGLRAAQAPPSSLHQASFSQQPHPPPA